MRIRSVAAFVTLVVALGACGDDGDSSREEGQGEDAQTGTDGAPTADSLTILVTNDDGVDAPGIDAIVDALADDEDLEVVVVAPAENNSGAGEKTTPGDPADLPATESTTASGYPAIAVDGFPADAVNYALAQGAEPDLVVSGVNLGQNLGPLTDISGTVGAARAAFAADIPALAVSAGFPESDDEAADYATAVEYALDLIEEFGEEEPNFELVLVNLNVPTCSDGEVRQLIEAPLAESDVGAVDPANCSSDLDAPVDDIEAFLNGFATVTALDTE